MIKAKKLNNEIKEENYERKIWSNMKWNKFK